MYIDSLLITKEHYKKMYKQTFNPYYLEMLMLTLDAIDKFYEENPEKQ